MAAPTCTCQGCGRREHARFDSNARRRQSRRGPRQASGRFRRRESPGRQQLRTGMVAVGEEDGQVQRGRGVRRGYRPRSCRGQAAAHQRSHILRLRHSRSAVLGTKPCTSSCRSESPRDRSTSSMSGQIPSGRYIPDQEVAGRATEDQASAASSTERRSCPGTPTGAIAKGPREGFHKLCSTSTHRARRGYGRPPRDRIGDPGLSRSEMGGTPPTSQTIKPLQRGNHRHGGRDV